MKISDLPTGACSVILRLRNGEEIRVLGRVIEKGGEKHFIARQSPKQSFAPETQVVWHRRRRE